MDLCAKRLKKTIGQFSVPDSLTTLELAFHPEVVSRAIRGLYVFELN